MPPSLWQADQIIRGMGSRCTISPVRAFPCIWCSWSLASNSGTNFLLSVAWQPWEENAQADALINESFRAFALALCVGVVWSGLKFLVLEWLAAEAADHFRAALALKSELRSAAQMPVGSGRRRKRSALPYAGGSRGDDAKAAKKTRRR